MTLWTLVIRSLQYHLRSHMVVMAGVAVSTAVLVGALLVGDTVRLSLTELTQERLGRIDRLLLAEHFFRDRCVGHLRERFTEHVADVAPAIVMTQVALSEAGSRRKVGRVTVLASGADFWKLRAAGTPQPKKLPGDFEIVINQTLAESLGVSVGDTVTLRLPFGESIPSDSPFGEKQDLVKSMPELEVIEVMPDRGFGRFELFPSQRTPRIAFVSPAGLRDALEIDGGWNAVFLAGTAETTIATQDELPAAMRLDLVDVGIRVERVRLEDPTSADDPKPSVYDYWALSSDRMLIRPAVDRAVRNAVGARGLPVLTYLANRIQRVGDGSAGGRAVPYSLVTAIELGRSFPLKDLAGNAIRPLDDDGIVLTGWLADELKAEVGDRLELTYFDPESPSGKLVERRATFTVRAVTPLTQPARPYLPDRQLVFDRRPTLANDPHLTPAVRGFTDQGSIEEWDVPFPVDYERVQEADEEYWRQYATTPKAFVAPGRGRKLWESRFGRTTSWRIDGTAADSADQLAAAIRKHLDWSQLGVVVHDLRARQMEASKGTTPFGVLFLSLSMFVIVAALLLVALLFQLSILRRVPSIGLLASVGFRRRRLLQWFLREELLVAFDGSVLGVLAGVAYARWIVWLLTTVWVGAISVPFLRFHATATSLATGFLAGLSICAATLILTVRGVLKRPPLELLRGRIDRVSSGKVRGRLWWSASIVCWIGAAVAAVYAATSGGMAQAGAFVGAGFLLLAGCLAAFWSWLHGRPFRVEPLLGKSPLWRWAIRSMSRHPRRSMLTIGLMGASSFLVVAMGAFQMRPSEEGTGGFEWMGESSTPIYADWGVELHSVLGASMKSEGATVFPFRLREGDMAACTNLYRPSQPRVIGVGAPFIRAMEKRSVGFQWGALPSDRRYRDHPWNVLESGAAGDGEPISVVLDRNTAMYSLQLYGGVGEEFELEYDGRPIRFRVAGLLADTVWQGMLLVGERDFRKMFPEESGYRFFLVDVPEGVARKAKQGLEERFADEGLEFEPTRDVLADLLAVQNTYLQTFQALGAIGLLLGTFGLAVVQLRNVLERTRELALLQAVGFRRRRLAGVVFRENTVLLTVGLGVGTVCALVAILPYQVASGSDLPLVRWLGLLAGIWGLGLLAGLAAVLAVLRLPLLSSLRNE